MHKKLVTLKENENDMQFVLTDQTDCIKMKYRSLVLQISLENNKLKFLKISGPHKAYSTFMSKVMKELASDNGEGYTGCLLNEMRHGSGVQVWPDNAKYEGEWRWDKANGNGTFQHANGDIYEGEWKDDKANGYGTFQHANGDIYEGEWKDDKANGYGIYKYVNGAEYNGHWKNDL